MAQTFVQLPDDSANTGKKEDHFTTSGTGQYREAVVIADPATDASVAKVTNAAPGSSDLGLVVRDPATATLSAQVLDYDTGAGTANTAIVGVALPASGGPVAGGTATNPLRTDPTGTTAQPVTDNGGNLSIDDGGNSITVDYATTGSGTATGALRVELPTNGTGVIATLGTITNVVHIDDNSGSLTVDNAGSFAVQVTSNIPGTGATNLGKAEDAVHTSGDTGVMALSVRQDEDVNGSIASTTGDYAPIMSSAAGRVKTLINPLFLVDNFSATTGWTVFNNDAGNLTTSLNHIVGTGSLIWDKLNGAANTTYALIQKTITSVNLYNLSTGAPFIQGAVLIPTITNTTNVIVRLGTDSSNYNEWAVPTTNMTAGIWQQARFNLIESTGYAGNGWDLTAVTYVAVGVQFDTEARTLTGIQWDGLQVLGGAVTDSVLASSTMVNTANVNLNRINAVTPAVSTGTVNTGTLRVTLATDVSLPTGTNNIGDVDVLTVIPGTGATSLGKAEDAAHTSGDTGVMSLAVRRDANTTLADTTGDYAPLQVDASGSLKVAIISGAGSGGTALADNAAYTPNTTSFTPIGGEVDDSGTTDATENSAAAVRMTTKRAIHVNLRDASGTELSVGGGTQYTEDVAAVADPVGNAIMVTRDDQISTVTEAEGDWSRLRGTSKGALWVALADSSGDPITSFGGGTQYTEDAASAADPVGTMMMMVRRDSLSGSEVTADSDNIAAKSTSKGELYVKHTDAIPITDNSGSLTVDYATTGSGTATGALRVELPTNGTGVIATVGAVTAITNSLPSGSNAIGKLAANSGVDIGDVDVTSVTPGTTATALGKAEDAAHTTADVGVMALAVRKNTAASTSDADGDYQPIITNTTGHLWVDASGQTLTVGSHAVTNAGTFVVQENGSALTSLQLIDDVVLTEDAAHSSGDKGVMALAVRASTPTDRSAGPTDGDYEPLAVNASGAVWCTPTPSTTGGWSMFSATSGDSLTALTATKQTIKASAGVLGGWYIYNPNTTAAYVIVYNTDTVTVGTTNPQLVLCIPPGAAANIEMTHGINFSTAISCAATTTGPGNTAPSTALEANFWYK